MRRSYAPASIPTVCSSSSPAIRGGGGAQLLSVGIELAWRDTMRDTRRPGEGAVTTAAPTSTTCRLPMDAARPLYAWLFGAGPGVHGCTAHPAPGRCLPY